MELIPVPAVTGGMMLFGWERAREVLQAWREWTTQAPATATTSIRIMQIPEIPSVPEFLRGRGVVIIDGAVIGGASEAAAVLAPLRALGPEMDTFATIPAAELQHLHMDPPNPVPGIGDHMLLSDLTPDAVEKVVHVAGATSSSPLLSVEFRHLGGELDRVRSGNGATAAIEAQFAMFAVGLTMDQVT
jgi:hypothetical protein